MSAQDPLIVSRLGSSMLAAECFDLLRWNTVGRLGFVSDSHGLQVLPMNYVLHGHDVFLRVSSVGLGAELLEGKADVGFEIDHHGETSSHGWSVLAKGSIARVNRTEIATWAEIDGLLQSWRRPDSAAIAQMQIISVTGRRVAKDTRTNVQGPRI